MKKIVIFAPFGYLILGLFLIFDAVGGTAFVREVLGLVEAKNCKQKKYLKGTFI